MRTDGGFIVIYRRMIQGDIGENYHLLALWVYILCNAAWRPVQVKFGKKRIRLERGQVVLSINELAADWDVSFRTIKRWLDYLEETNRVTIERTKVGCLITIVKYDGYQDKNKRRGEDDAQGDDEGESEDGSEDRSEDGSEHASEDESQNPCGSRLPASLTREQDNKRTREQDKDICRGVAPSSLIGAEIVVEVVTETDKPAVPMVEDGQTIPAEVGHSWGPGWDAETPPPSDEHGPTLVDGGGQPSKRSSGLFCDSDDEKPAAVVKTKAKPKKTKAETDAQLELNRAVWDRYRMTFRFVYGDDPLRNQRVNSLIAQFAKRIGGDAPEVIEHYVKHKHPYYLREGHQLAPAVQHAEKLWTEWKTGRTGPMTARASEQAARDQQNRDAIARVMEKRRAAKEGDQG